MLIRYNITLAAAVAVSAFTVPLSYATEQTGRLIQAVSNKNTVENAETREAVEALVNFLRARIDMLEVRLGAVENCQRQLMFYNGVICVPLEYVERSGDALRAQIANRADAADYAAAATWANNAGLANMAANAATAQIANWAGSANAASWAAQAAYANGASSADYANFANVANWAGNAGSADYANRANSAGSADTASHASTADRATTAEQADYAHSTATKKPVAVEERWVDLITYGSNPKSSTADLCVLNNVGSWMGGLWGSCGVTGSANNWTLAGSWYSGNVTCSMRCYNFQ